MTEIFLENNRLDVTADISALLTFALDDVKDFSSRQTTFSKTIVLPGTANNNKLFGNIFDTGSANDYDAALSNVGYNFNAAKSAAVIIFQDNQQTFVGKLRLLSIVRDGKHIEYEVALFGNLTALNVALAPSSTNNPDGTTVNNKGYLENLDFSVYDHTYDASHITGSWDNTPGSGYYYPLIDYGNYSTAKMQTDYTSVSFKQKHDWLVGTFRPALYVKDYIDRMFAAAKFTYVSDLFNSTRFKNLIIPCNTRVLYTKVTRVLYATETITETVINSSTGHTVTTAEWDGYQAGAFTYSGGVFQYNGTDTLNITFSWKLLGHRIASVNGSTFNINVKHNGATIKSQSFTVPTASVPYNWVDNITLSLAHNDTVEISFAYATGSGVVVTLENGSYMQLDSDVPQLVPIAYGQTVTLNDSVPRNIKQIDFLVSLVKLFNLYVWEDQNDSTKIHIEPFVDFYKPDSTNAVDWTYKLNRDKPVTIKPMSELNANVYNFKMADDSDYYNDQYKKRYNQNYGDYIFNSQFEFSTDNQDCQLIFAGTPIVGYNSEDKVYSTIFKRTGDDATPTEEQTDSVIRILQSKKVVTSTDYPVTAWNIVSSNGATVLSSGLTSYGYAGHFNDPNIPGNDLNFGALNQLYFALATGALNVTQFNLYWSSYMAEITDKDAKLVSSSFYLKPVDIYNLDFSKYIQLDGVLFRLNKITDYNASAPGDCVCELIKVLNTTYTF